MLLAKKLAKFLGELSDIDQETREEMVERLENDPKYMHKVGDHILLLLDSTSSLEKAELMGRAFKAYCEGSIDSEMLQMLYYAIDRILLIDLKYLPQLVESRKHSLLDFQTPASFINAGLVYYPFNISTTSLDENRKLCSAFIEHLLAPNSS